MKFGLLGPLQVLDPAGAPVDVGGRQARLVVAILLAARGRLVTADALADEVWGDERPATAMGTLQSYVSRLRRKFASAALVYEEPGYRLDVGAGDVDFRRFEALVDEGRARLAAGRPEEARDALAAAEGLWRGPALLEFRERPFAVGLVTRLEEQRISATEDRIEAELTLGRHAAAAGELGELVREHPLREGLRAHLAVALYRSGRQADALRAIEDARRTLREELGVELGRPLRELEAAILDHDPALEPATAIRAAAAPAVTSPPAAPAAPPGRRGLIGRRDELAAVLDALAEAAQASRIVVIEGEPGIGKTRLAEELRVEAEARGCHVVWGRGYEGGGAPALWPWLAPIRELADRHEADAARLHELNATEAVVTAGRASVARFERFEALAAFLERVAAATPVAVVLDDIQWADEASLELLAFLSARLEGGVLLVLTMRRLEVGRQDALTEALAAIARRPGSRRLLLRGLALEDTTELMEAATGRLLGPEVARAIHDRAEGNPFYATELARLVLDEESVDAATVGRATVPAGVGAVIRRRLGHLPATTVDLLAAAAVMGRDIEVGLLTRVSGLSTDACLDRLEPAVVHRLLGDLPGQPSTFRFSHALVREALLEDMSSLRRARLHLRVADAIEAGPAGVSDDEAEVLAEHLWRAVPVGVGRRAAEALERAAEVAIRRVAFASAEDMLRRAVDLRRTTAASAEDQEAELLAIHRLLTVARARRYFAGAATPSLIERAKELGRRTGRHDVLIDVLWVEWSAATTAARLEEADALCDAFVAVLRASPDPDHLAFAEDALSIQRWQAGRIAEAVEHIERAIVLRRQVVDRGPSLEFAGERQILGRLFWLLMHSLAGDVDDAVAQYEALADQAPDKFILTEIGGFLSVVAEAMHDWEACERIGRRIQAVDSDADFSFYSSMALMALAVARARAGDVDGARPLFEHNRARYVGIGGGSGLAGHDAAWAMALAAAGRPREAAAAAELARRTQDTLREGWLEPIVRTAEAVAAHVGGDVDGAAKRLAEAVALATDQGALGLARRAGAVATGLGLPA